MPFTCPHCGSQVPTGSTTHYPGQCAVIQGRARDKAKKEREKNAPKDDRRGSGRHSK